MEGINRFSRNIIFSFENIDKYFTIDYPIYVYNLHLLDPKTKISLQTLLSCIDYTSKDEFIDKVNKYKNKIKKCDKYKQYITLCIRGKSIDRKNKYQTFWGLITRGIFYIFLKQKLEKELNPSIRFPKDLADGNFDPEKYINNLDINHLYYLCKNIMRREGRYNQAKQFFHVGTLLITFIIDGKLNNNRF